MKTFLLATFRNCQFAALSSSTVKISAHFFFLHLKQYDNTRIFFSIEPNFSHSNGYSITTASMTGSGSSLMLNCNFPGALGQASSVSASQAGTVSHSLSFRASIVFPRVNVSKIQFSFNMPPLALGEFSRISETRFATKTGCLLLLA